MPDFALVLAADARRLKDGEKGLDDLVRKAEQAETRVGKATDGMGSKFGSLADLIKGGATKAVVALGALAAGFATFRTVEMATAKALDFNRAIAETSTLIKGTPAQLDLLASSARKMAIAYGQDATSEVRGFYEALSAGADSIEEAIAIVDVANKAAIGGATDTATAVDILTSALNVYAKEGLTAADASDALFVGVVAGKTTMEELARSMGQVLPMAQTMGVTFDSVTAAVAALTAGGIRTSEAVTGVRASLVAVLNPSKEAQELAKKLGVDFSEAGMRAKGFGGFMSDVVAKTGGSATAMQTLFGSVEATTAALAFAGTAGDAYGDIMDQMAVKAGTTQGAFEKMNESLPGRFDQAWAKLQDTLLSLGNAVLPLLIPALETLAAAMQVVVGVVTIAFSQFSPLRIVFDLLVVSLTGLGKILTVVGNALSWLNTEIITPLAALVGDVLIAAFNDATTVVGNFLTAMVPEPIREFFATIVEGVSWAYDALVTLNTKIAGTGTMLSILSNVASEVAQKIGAGWNWIAATAQAAAYSLQAAFLGALQDVSYAWVELTWSIADGMNSLFDMGLTGASGLGTQALAAGRAAAQGAAAAAEGAANAASIAFNAPIASLGALSLLLQDTSTSAVGAGTDLEGMGDKISGAADKADALGTGLGSGAGGAKKTEKAVDELTKKINDTLMKAVDGVGKAIGDWVAGGFKKIENVFDGIRDSFKSMISDLVQTAVSNPIKIMMGMQQGANGAWSVKPESMMGKISAGIGAVSGGFFSGLSGVASAFSTGGPAGAGAAIKTALGGATSSLAGFGTALGAIAGPLAVVGLIFAAFKKKTTLLAAGLEVSVGHLSAAVTKFETTKTSTLFGLINKTSTNRTAADTATADPVRRAVTAMQTSIMAAADSLGVAQYAFDYFAYQITLDTRGMSQDAAIAALEERLGEMGDAFANLVQGLAALQKEGEGAQAALNRLSLSLGAVDSMADTLGLVFDRTGLAGADLASNLIDAFGSIEAMSSATASYYAVFYTETERVAVATRQATDALAELGIAMPTTRDQYRAMIESLDLTSASGQQMIAALISLSAVMDQVLPKVDSFTAAMTAIVSGVNAGLDSMISGTESAMQAAERAAQDWYNAAKTLRDYIADLRGAQSDIVTVTAARAASEARFQMLLAQAMSGDQNAYQQLTGAADSLLESTTATAHSTVEAAIQQARIIADLTKAANVADISGAQNDVIAGLLGQQKDVLVGIKDYLAAGGVLDPAHIDALNGQLGALQAAIAEVQAIDYAQIVASMDITATLISQVDDPALRALLESGTGTIQGTIDFVANTADLTPEERFLALHAATVHQRTIELLATSTGISKKDAVLALQTSSDVERNIIATLQSSLSESDRRLALVASDNILRTIGVALGGDVDPVARDLALAQSSAITRTVTAMLDQSGLTAEQRTFLGALSGASAGTITLGGSFAWDPSTGFQTWLEATTQGNIAAPLNALVGPMDALRTQLATLTGEIRVQNAADEASKAAAEAAAAKAKVIEDAQAKLSALAAARDAAIGGVQKAVGDVAAFDAATGGYLGKDGKAVTPSVNADGSLNYSADGFYGTDAASLAAWKATFHGENGLERAMFRADRARRIAELKLERARQAVIDLGGIPAFLRGGDHLGGLRIVGERGPELEATGKSRIYSARQTREMMQPDNSEMVAELRHLRKQVAEFQEQSRQLDTRLGTYERRQMQMLERWENEGMPPTRAVL